VGPAGAGREWGSAGKEPVLFLKHINLQLHDMMEQLGVLLELVEGRGPRCETCSISDTYHPQRG